MFDDGRYEKSARGDFYIELYESEKYGRGCCTAAWPPHEIVPHLCAFDEYGKERFCFVKKQPVTDYETYQMIRALWANEMECLKYSGADPEIIQRLSEIGRITDFARAFDETDPRKLRNICTFSLPYMNSDIGKLSERLRDFFLLKQSHKDSLKATSVERAGESKMSFDFSWTADANRKDPPIYHEIIVTFVSKPQSNWMIEHSRKRQQAGSVSLSFHVDDFLRELKGIEDIRWYSEEEWNDGEPTFWRSTPY